MSTNQNDSDIKHLKDDRPQPSEPITIINGKSIRYKRGRAEIEASEDKAVQQIYDEVWEYISQINQQLVSDKLEDNDGFMHKGMQRIANGLADFKIDDVKKRFAFMVFNARPTFYLNPTIEPNPEQDLQDIISIIYRVGEHDQDFWNNIAHMIR